MNVGKVVFNHDGEAVVDQARILTSAFKMMYSSGKFEEPA
jgi:hypothetical protein